MGSSLQCNEFEVVNKTRFVFTHIINYKYYRLIYLLHVVSHHYKLHSRVPQLDVPLFDIHASDRSSADMPF